MTGEQAFMQSLREVIVKRLVRELPKWRSINVPTTARCAHGVATAAHLFEQKLSRLRLTLARMTNRVKGAD